MSAHTFRYILAGGALLLITGLYFLPRVVVENEASEAKMEAPTTANATSSEDTVVVHTADDGHDHSTESGDSHSHPLSLPAEVAEKVDTWRTNFAQSTDFDARLVALDSLEAIWKGVQRWDSIAIYTEMLLNTYPAKEQRLLPRVGVAYYEALNRAGSELEAANWGEAARKYLKKLQVSNPDDLDTQVRLGMTYVPTQNPMQGILLIRSVLEKDENHPLALLNLGLLSMRSGQFDKAVERLEKLTKVQAKNGQAFFYLGVAYVESGIPEKARAAFTAAKENAGEDQLLATAADNYLKNLP